MADKKISKREARAIRNSPLSDLIASKLMTNESIGEALKNAIDQKIQAHAKGMKEKFNILFIAKVLTGGKIDSEILAKMLGLNMEEAKRGRKVKKEKVSEVPSTGIKSTEELKEEKQEKEKAKRIKEGEKESQEVQKTLKVKQTGRATRVKKGDSVSDVLSKIYTLLQDSFDKKKLDKEIEDDFREQRKMDDERRHKEFLDALRKAFKSVVEENEKNLKKVADSAGSSGNSSIWDFIEKGLEDILEYRLLRSLLQRFPKGLPDIPKFEPPAVEPPVTTTPRLPAPEVPKLPAPEAPKLPSPEAPKALPAPETPKIPAAEGDVIEMAKNAEGVFEPTGKVSNLGRAAQTATKIAAPTLEEFSPGIALISKIGGAALEWAGPVLTALSVGLEVKGAFDRNDYLDKALQYAALTGKTEPLLKAVTAIEEASDDIQVRSVSPSSGMENEISMNLELTRDQRIKESFQQQIKKLPKIRDELVKKAKAAAEKKQEVKSDSKLPSSFSFMPEGTKLGQFINNRSKENEDLLFSPKGDSNPSSSVMFQNNNSGSTQEVNELFPASPFNVESTRKRSLVSGIRPL